MNRCARTKPTVKGSAGEEGEKTYEECRDTEREGRESETEGVKKAGARTTSRTRNPNPYFICKNPTDTSVLTVADQKNLKNDY